jgi:hypothetical protein
MDQRKPDRITRMLNALNDPTSCMGTNGVVARLFRLYWA